MVLLMLSYWGIFTFVSRERTAFLDQRPVHYSIPSRFTAPAALEFKGLVSNYLFLKVITDTGDILGKKKRLNKDMVDYIVSSVDTITDLDPKFWDPYLFASLLLSWGLGQYDEANTLLTKAEKHLPNDYRPFYFKGFNYYYFLKDNKKAAEYMIKASKLPGSPGYLPYLATRLSVYSANQKAAAAFLEEMIRTTRNEAVVHQLKLRLETVKHLIMLEKHVMEYKNRFGVFPSHLKDLISMGFIKTIPKDPHGGEYFIMKNGRVYTTSRMIEQKKSLP